MSLKVYVYMWMKPGEDRVFTSSSRPPDYHVNRLKREGYYFFRLEAELPIEFETADKEIRARADSFDDIVDTSKLRNVFKRRHDEEE